MNAETLKTQPERPPYMEGWMSEAETLAELRKLKPTLHKSTLGRMRQRREITATKFAGAWFYKPESAFEQIQFLRAAA
jgi:hypothetical protein